MQARDGKINLPRKQFQALRKRKMQTAGREAVMSTFLKTVQVVAVFLGLGMPSICIWQTHVAFPQDGFISNLPGYVLFPLVFIFLAVLLYARAEIELQAERREP